jgi:oligopeptide/dipeptide ABC transporter ATP-binding protein
MADDVAVMYAGKIVEYGTAEDIFASFCHPYTEGLFKSLPGRTPRGQKLYTIAGNVPSALAFSEGCRFHPRCPLAVDMCKTKEPPLIDVGSVHQAGSIHRASKQHWCACWVRAGGVYRSGGTTYHSEGEAHRSGGVTNRSGGTT